MLANKVVKFENESTKIFNAIQGYFKELNRKNRDFEHAHSKQNTQTAYETDIRLFFELVKGKQKKFEIEHLTMEDIQITIEDLEEFVELLCDLKNEDGSNKYVNKTINRKLVAVKNIVKYLGKKKLIKDIPRVELVKGEKERDNHYGVLSIEEVWKMVDIVEQLKSPRQKGQQKKYAILFSVDSCIRKSALQSLKWSDFTVRETDVLVKWVDKGNKDFRQLISKDFYEELLTIKTNSEFVFDLSNDILQDMMTMLREKLNIEPSRNVTWHSLRKTGVTFRYRVTGDILEAKRAAGHSNINTTTIYIDDEDYGALGAVSSGGKINNELYQEVDHETLIKAISMCKKDLQLILNVKLHELIKQNN